MNKDLILKNSYDFKSVLDNGKSYRNREYIIYIANNNLNKYRIGISVGKKIGNAIHRNYYKRIIRNFCHNSKSHYQNGKDYIIIFKKEGLNLDFHGLEASFNSLLDKIEKEK